ncbi:hypothetical protein L195_g003003 [Trifolium pratense]|uniref:mTERF protein n=1 Tax=Trifolium pratense TaxID=57577 RepID=A0A2K3NU18_TRIPR|nr:hypothetical protein L195_g003003 [Trifolium pratense]
MFKPFLFHNAFRLSTTTLHHSSFQFSLRFLTTSPSHPFAVSYLIDKFGFSSEFAFKASKTLHFKTSKNPDSVLNVFTTYGFTDSDIQNIIRREPWLLSCNPRFMRSSLNNRVIPVYKLGVCDSSIAKIICSHIIFCKPRVFEEMVEELKNMGFDPSKIYFGDALLAKLGLSKSKWDAKIDTFKKWGWSEETILEAIRKQPKCMLASTDKINRVMQFWVNDLGWDSSYLAKGPGMFSYALEKRIVPRAMVVICLQTKGLRSESASLLSPFYVSEKVFLERFVLCFKEEETAHLLNLYRTMMKVGDEKVLPGLVD